jgi:hypothetical protein
VLPYKRDTNHNNEHGVDINKDGIPLMFTASASASSSVDINDAGIPETFAASDDEVEDKKTDEPKDVITIDDDSSEDMSDIDVNLTDSIPAGKGQQQIDTIENRITEAAKGNSMGTTRILGKIHCECYSKQSYIRQMVRAADGQCFGIEKGIGNSWNSPTPLSSHPYLIIPTMLRFLLT